MNMGVQFLGGAGTVTGSKYLLKVDDYRILVDCGLFQGLKKLRERNWDPFPIDPASLDAVILTHAHLDHSGYLPRLVKEGFDGPIYCTPSTADLLELLLRDSGKLQEEEAAFARRKGFSRHDPPLPLYDMQDAERVLPLLRTIPFRDTLSISPQVTAHYHFAGHILGAGILELDIQGRQQRKRILFSGDLGRSSDPILYAPEHVSQADVVFIESTYGSREHNTPTSKEEMLNLILEVVKKKGVLLIPAFSIGRTQNVIMYLKDFLEHGLIPEIPIYLDSPMAISATELYVKHTQAHKLTSDEIAHAESFLAIRKLIHLMRSSEQSRQLNDMKGPAIIVSASGMMTGGRIIHHLYHRLPNPEDILLVVGYQAPGTRGRRLLDGEPTLRMFGRDVPVRCKIHYADGLSAHADQSELLDWAGGFESPPKHAFVIHGEPDSARVLADKLKEDHDWPARVPDYLETIQLFDNI